MKIAWKKASLIRERRLTAGGIVHDQPRRVPGTDFLVHRMRGPQGAGLMLTDTRGRLIRPLVLGPGEYGPLSPMPGGGMGLFAHRESPEHSWAVHSVTLSESTSPEQGVVLETRGAHAFDPVLHPQKPAFFFAGDEASPGTCHLWEADPSRKEKRPLTSHPDRSDDQPAISPSGRLLAFRGRSGESVDLYLLDLETQETRRLTAAPGQSQEPAFLDEYRLVFSRRLPSGDQGLLLLDLLRGREKWITDAVRCLGAPCPDLSPRGKLRVFFHSILRKEGRELGSDVCSARLSGVKLEAES